MVWLRVTSTVRDRRVLVVGAARSGIAAAEVLARRGAIVTLTDIRETVDAADRLRAAGITLELGGHKTETIAAADLIVVSPGVPLDQPIFEVARRRGTEIIGELELASRWTRGRVIAITGTKGKSTTTTLIGRMLGAAGHTTLVGGNIGVPLSAQVDASTPETVHVVETSSFQLEATIDIPPLDRCVAELRRRPPGSTSEHRMRTQPPRRASSPIRPKTTGPSSTQTMPW